MATATLNATVRADTGKGVARKLRSKGEVPAIVYGHGREPQPLAINTRELEKLLSTIAVSSTVVELALGGTSARTLIREIQRHPFKPMIMHVDFQELVAGETVTVRIPLVFVGIPEGVRTSGGVLEQIMHEVEIDVDPSNIPNHIDVDVTNLGLGKTLHVSDLTLPEGVTVLEDEDATMCAVALPKTVVEAAPAEAEAAEAAPEPELIRKAKPEEGEV